MGPNLMAMILIGMSIYMKINLKGVSFMKINLMGMELYGDEVYRDEPYGGEPDWVDLVAACG